MIMCKSALAAAVNKTMFPGMQGGPLMHVIAAKAVAFKEALTPEFREYQRQIVANGKALARSAHRAGLPPRVRAAPDTHVMLVDVAWQGSHGQGGRSGRWTRPGSPVNKNADPLRHPPAHGHLGHSTGNSGAHDPGDARRRDAPGWRPSVAEVLADVESADRQAAVAAKVGTCVRRFRCTGSA